LFSVKASAFVSRGGDDNRVTLADNTTPLFLLLDDEKEG